MTTRQHGDVDTKGGAGTSDSVSPIAALLMLVLLLMPFPVVLVKFTPGDRLYDYQVILFPSDIPLALLILAMVPAIVRRVRDRSLGPTGLCWLALVGWLLVSFAFHPSSRGVADLLRLLGVLAMVVAALNLRSTAERGLVLGTFVVVAVLQAGLALTQLLRKAPVGLSSLGEFKSPFNYFGTARAPQGTMVHPYLLAGLALLAGFLAVVPAARRRQLLPWVVLAAAAVAPIGFTYSRAALLGLAAGVVCLATGVLPDRRRYLPAVVALCIGAGVPALVWNHGWLQRAHQTGSRSQLTTDRGWLIHEARTLIDDHPVVGVGPGRYVLALTEKYKVEPNRGVGFFKPVHNLPILLAAEGGIPAGVAFTALLLVVGWRALRSGRLALALFLVYLPFTLLDHFPYSFPQGLVMTGVWLAGLELLYRDR